jgi:hypothetical protein
MVPSWLSTTPFTPIVCQPNNSTRESVDIRQFEGIATVYSTITNAETRYNLHFSCYERDSLISLWSLLLFHVCVLRKVIISVKKPVLPHLDTLSRPFAAKGKINYKKPRNYKTNYVFLLKIPAPKGSRKQRQQRKVEGRGYRYFYNIGFGYEGLCKAKIINCCCFIHGTCRLTQSPH